MQKSDLKTGMLLKTRGGRVGLVMLGTSKGDVIVGNGNGGDIPDSQQTWCPLKAYKDDLTYDLTYPGVTDSDVVKVYEFSNNIDGASFKTESRNLLWERKDNIFQLTRDYDAIVDAENSIVKVGCQSIPFHKVTELYHLINK
jgi:hypothetical protein